MRSQRSILLTLLAILCLPLFSSAALATTAVIPTDRDMVVSARAIITGRVTDITTGVDPLTDVVFTYVRVEVGDVLKGQIPEGEIVLKQPGGEAFDKGTIIFGMPRYELGQEVLLYLDTWMDGSLRVHQWFLGKFNIVRDPSSDRVLMMREEPGDKVHVMASDASNRTSLSELEPYKEMVRQLVGANRKRISEFEREHYSGIPILARPPEFDQLRQDRQFVPQWTNVNPATPIRWFEPDNNQPLVFLINTQGAFHSKAVEDLEAAMNTWSTASGTSMRVVNGGLTTGCGLTAADGKNTISFTNCDGYFSRADGDAGILAAAGIVRYTNSESKTVSGVRYFKAVEGNLSFNPFASRFFTDRCNFREISLHEMGHALGFGHTSDTNAIMYPFAHFDGRCALLSEDDRAGIASMYPGGAGGGRLSITTSADLPQTSMHTEYGKTLSASGGAGSYQWGMTGGRLPSGLQLSPSGFLYGETNESGTFNFDAQVRDRSGNSAQKSFSLFVQPPLPPPSIQDMVYVKKRLKITGSNFTSTATVLVDGQGRSATLNGTLLVTDKKKKIKPGVHTVEVINSDGKRSNTYTLIIN
ncbi:MAG TPA: matrixin family metalloprotease [Blastocatellia bacterium]|nr:matrixin family metalloprotease [Blastocatellia bacterium]